MWALLPFLVGAVLAQEGRGDMREDVGDMREDPDAEDTREDRGRVLPDDMREEPTDKPEKERKEPESYTVVQVSTYFSEDACYSGKPPLHTRSELMMLPEQLGDHTCEDHSFSGVKGLMSREYKCTDPIEEGVSMLLVMDYASADCGYGSNRFTNNMITNVLWVMQGECFFDNRLNQQAWVKWAWKGVCGAEELPQEVTVEDEQCDQKSKRLFAEKRDEICKEDPDAELNCDCLLRMSESMDSFVGELDCLMSEDALSTVQQQLYLCERFTIPEVEEKEKCRGRTRQECKADQDLCIWYKAGEKCFDVGHQCSQAFSKKECRNLDCYWSSDSRLCFNKDTNDVCTSYTKRAKCNKNEACEWSNEKKKCCTPGPFPC